MKKPSPSRRIALARGRRGCCGRLEPLESRIALTTVTWTGLGSLLDDNWSLGLNWSTLTAPANGDDVVFTGILLTTGVNDISNLSLNSITFSTNNFSMSGNAITLAAGGGGITLGSGVTGAETLGMDITFAGDQTISISSASASLTLAGGISGPGGLTETGAGQLVLSGTNSYEGATAIGAGKLTSGIANAIPTGSDLSVSAGAIFDQAGFSQAVASISGAGTITDSGAAANLTVNGSTATLYSGVISGPLTLIKAGNGSLSLSGPVNTYSGGTDIDGGVLEFASGALGSGTIHFDGGTLQYAAGNVQDLSSRITGSGGMIDIDPGENAITFASSLGVSDTGGLGVVGNGTLVLTAANGYSGPTEVSAGEVLVDGSTSAASDVDVRSGAMLGGTGAVGGSVTVESGGTLAPGDPPSGPGNLHTGEVTFSPGALYGVQLNGNLAGLNYDQVVSSGAINLGGATLEASLGFTPAVGDSFTIAQAAGLISGTFGGLPEGAMLFIGGRLFEISYAGAGAKSLTLTVVQATLTVSGILAEDKTYDGTGTATLNASGATLNGIVSGDPGTVILHTASASGSFASKNVGHGIAVNVSGLTISGSSAVNYILTQPTIFADISPRTLDVTASAQGKVYDGNSSAAITLSDDRIAGDDLTVDYGSATFSDRNAGDGKTVTVAGLNISGADAGNYTLAASTVLAVADITPMPLTITAAPDSKVYDGTPASAATPFITSGTVIAGDAADFTQSYADKNAGTNLLLIPDGTVDDGNGGENYAITFVSDTLGTILPRVLDVTAAGQDKTYDGTTAAVVSLSDDRLPGDDLNITYGSAAFSDKNAGLAKLVQITGLAIAGGSDAGNYSLASTVATTSADISARVLNVLAAGQNKIYDGTTAATVILSSDAVAGDQVALGYGAATFADKEAGVAKTVSVSGIAITGGADAGNYLLAITSATASADITPRTIDISATAQSKTYDGTTAATVSLSSDALAGDDVSIDFGAAGFSDKNAGTAKTVTVSGITISGGDAANYSLAGTTVFATADILARALNITASGEARIYDGTENAEVSLSSDALPGDVVNLGYASATFSDKNVGTAKVISISGITVSGADAGNYIPVSTTTTATADITPRPLTISATAQSKVYDGTTTAITSLLSDGVTGDALSLSYADAEFTDKNAGTGKAVNISGLSVSGADAANYFLTATSAVANADITPRALHVAATGEAKVYDGTRTATVLLAGDELPGDVIDLSASSALFSDKNAGIAKAITASGIAMSGPDAGNYALAATTALTTADIAPRPISVSATPDSKAYDGTTTSRAVPTISAGTLAPGDSATFSQVFSGQGASASDLLIPDGAINDGNAGANYAITWVPAAGSISPRTLAVSATVSDKVYDGTASATAALADDALPGDGVSVSYLAAAFADKNVGHAKSVLITGLAIQGVDAADYALEAPSISTTASITQRPLSIMLTGLDKIYDGTTAAAVIYSDDQLPGDAVEVTYTSATFSDKNAGTAKVITVAGLSISGADAENYTLASPPATAAADIFPRELDVSVISADKVYDGTTQAPVTLSDDRVPGDRLRVRFAAATFPSKNVGTDLPVAITGLTLTGRDAANYTLVQTSLSALGNITPRPLHVIVIAQNKTYDGASQAVISLSDDHLAGDSVILTYGSANFASPSVGEQVPVNVNGIAIAGGADAQNYTLVSSTATAFGNIEAPAIPTPPGNPNPPPIPPTPPPQPPVLTPLPPPPSSPPVAPGHPLGILFGPAGPNPASGSGGEAVAFEPIAAISRTTTSSLASARYPVVIVEPIRSPVATTALPPIEPTIPVALPAEPQIPLLVSPLPVVKIAEAAPAISRLGLFIKFSITAGLVIQFVIPRSILASLFASVPVWRWFDPVPVIKSRRKGRSFGGGASAPSIEPAEIGSVF